jgi:hypothetical protein
MLRAVKLQFIFVFIIIAISPCPTSYSKESSMFRGEIHAMELTVPQLFQSGARWARGSKDYSKGHHLGSASELLLLSHFLLGVFAGAPVCQRSS